jgi:hypothetical protein
MIQAIKDGKSHRAGEPSISSNDAEKAELEERE